MLINNHLFKSGNKKFNFYHRFIFRNFVKNHYLYNIFSNLIYKIFYQLIKKINYIGEILLKTEFILKETKFKNNYKIIHTTIEQRNKKTIKKLGQNFSTIYRFQKIRVLNKFLVSKFQKVSNQQRKIYVNKIPISPNSSNSKFFDIIENLKRGTFLNRKNDIKKKIRDILLKIMKVFQMSFKVLHYFSNLNMINIRIRQKMIYEHF